MRRRPFPSAHCLTFEAAGLNAGGGPRAGPRSKPIGGHCLMQANMATRYRSAIDAWLTFEPKLAARRLGRRPIVASMAQ
jgi:hypothetical protein